LTKLVKSIQVAPLVLDDYYFVCFLQTVSSSGAILLMLFETNLKATAWLTVCNKSEVGLELAPAVRPVKE